ncbi:MAG TPA: heme o synthase [Mycobacteriales bacterium]|nr:heme o synthase [Mycobacteriales bacterium]
MTALADVAADHALERPARSRSELLRGYVALTKPRIIELLLVTTVPTMIVAERGMPSWWLVVATLVGGTFAAGSANTINCYVDRDIDVKMHRTERRPLARQVVTPAEALRFGIALGVLATLWLGLFVNWLSAGLGVAAILFYVFVYTLGMKRSTPQNIVIGGAAGCVPVLIGWAAVTGRVEVGAWVLFAIIFFWTPPHFWALAMKFSDDYARAGVPMLPVVAGERETARQIVLYSWLMVAISLLLHPVARLGWVYLGAAVVLGGVFLREAYGLRRRVAADGPTKPMRLFHWSITYLTLLFVAMAVDQLVS